MHAHNATQPCILLVQVLLHVHVCLKYAVVQYSSYASLRVVSRFSGGGALVDSYVQDFFQEEHSATDVIIVHNNVHVLVLQAKVLHTAHHTSTQSVLPAVSAHSAATFLGLHWQTFS